MLTSNFPVDRLAKSYGDIWQSFAACVADYSQYEQELLFWRYAEKYYWLEFRTAAAA
jgi:predicted TIM-barrel fold metal-dependent hydrolase